MIDDSAAVRAFRRGARAGARQLAGMARRQLVPNETAGAPDRKGVLQLAWRLAEPRTVTWAFLAWNTH
ncbi:MAG: hypothetical protein ACLUE1_02245 [Adlercreutzia equolifaciens]